MLALIVSLKSSMSCVTMRDLRAQACAPKRRDVVAVDEQAAGLGS